MNQEIKKIPFENGELLGVRTEDGKVWLAIKKACLDLGMTDSQARTQIQKVADDFVLKANYQNILIVQKEGQRMVNREIACISEDCVTLWLAKIQLTESLQQQAPQTVKKLVAYQLKAQKVLHAAFMGTEEKKKAFYNDMGLHGEILEIKDKISQMDTTMQTLIDNTTINSRQAQKLLFAAKDRVNWLLGGAHTKEYGANSRMYFKNLWLGLCSQFEVGSYKDLNPVHMQRAMEYIGDWVYLED